MGLDNANSAIEVSNALAQYRKALQRSIERLDEGIEEIYVERKEGEDFALAIEIITATGINGFSCGTESQKELWLGY